jgi:hypothetical protein
MSGVPLWVVANVTFAVRGLCSTAPIRDQGLVTLPPLLIVRFDVSWQLAGMFRWAAFVLS